MAGHSTFAGIKALAARAGFKLGQDGTPKLRADGEGDEAVADDEAEDDEDDAGTGGQEDGAGGSGAPGPGEGEGNEESDDGDEDDDAGTGEGQGDDAGGAQAGGGAPRRSADFRAGQRHGATQANGRWAAVLASPVARANLEMATDLLATSSMAPAAIVEMCDRYKGESSAKRLLDTTQKVSLGVDPRGGAAPDDAAASRQTSIERGNRQTARNASRGGSVVRKSRRAAAAGKQEK